VMLDSFSGSSQLKAVPIADLVDDVSTRNPSQAEPDLLFTYIDLSAVDQEHKTIIAAKRVLGAEAPSRARQVVRAGDVLVSTVRPNLNGVAVVPEEYDDAIASTGFCVLRPRKGRLDSSFLFHWVRSALFVDRMVQQATGASYPAVSDGIVRKSVIPAPPLSEQRRIAAILDQADALRSKRRAALAQLDEMAQAIFVEMFGDPVTNALGLPLKPLGDLGDLERGVSKHRPRNDPTLLNGPYPLVQTGDIAKCHGYIRKYSSTYSEVGLRQSRLWPKGTLCITIAANIGKTGILDFEGCFPDSVVGFTPGPLVRTEYVQIWMSFIQRTLEDGAPQSAQKNINLAILRDLSIPLASIGLQDKFVKRLACVDRLKISYQQHSVKLDALFTSIQHRAFRGEL